MAEYKREELGENPLLNSLEILVNRVKSDNAYKAHGAGKDDVVFTPANYDYEAVPFCKVFADATRRKDIVKLTNRAQGLLMWIFFEIKAGKDFLWINKERYMEENEIGSLNTYKSAVNELVMTKYLSKTIKPDTYWINPHYFFLGDRLKAFPDKIKIRYEKD